MVRSRYRILGQIGQGQFGRVFCAIDRSRGNLVALKDLDQVYYPTKKFLREITYLVSLRHPNLVSFKGIEHHRGGRYLVMDYCNGGNLRDLMDLHPNLSLQHSIHCICEILAGLAHAHERGIVHCDIKPENILLNVTATGWTAKIADFGISRLIDEIESQRQRGGYTGSPAYMAPERFYGRYSPASDIYSVGILLYELITHDRPFSGSLGDLMSAHLSQPVKMPDTIPPPLRSIVDQALRKLPQRRFESAKAMINALEEAREALSTAFTPPIASAPIEKPLESHQPAIDPDRTWSVTASAKQWKIENLLTKSSRSCRRQKPDRFLLLDRRYGIAVFVSGDITYLYPFDRRGNLYRRLTLPFPLPSLTANPTDPYQLLGINPHPDPFAVMIHLKPVLLQRIPLDFVPDRVSFRSGEFQLETAGGEVFRLDRESLSIEKI